MDMTMQGKRAVVTAGASGIGLAIARTFHAAGAQVHVCDVDGKAIASFLAELSGASATLADVADAAQVDAMFADLAARWGSLDVLVNNAGIAGPTQRVEDIDAQEWYRTIAVNLHGAFHCTRRAVPLIRAAGGGSIINLSSAAGRLGFPLRTPYSASKWAIVGLTQSLAMELGPHHIRVNAILPGLVAGERIERVIAAKAKALGISEAEQRERMLSKVSLRRMVSAQDVANMALFVASPAGENVSGQSLSVCGNTEHIG
jgi:NAD(P)-dependent dehydrogenase (short-subunit alcohol dehydrogenase family)